MNLFNVRETMKNTIRVIFISTTSFHNGKNGNVKFRLRYASLTTKKAQKLIPVLSHFCGDAAMKFIVVMKITLILFRA